MPDTPPNQSLFAAGHPKTSITASIRPGEQRSPAATDHGDR
jgi:hypothetical protein